MARKMLVADLLCGAGGSSTGAARALAGLGLEMELVCVNHWPVAIETHRRNHPEIRQIGNAVSVRKMQACVGAIMADAAPKRTRAPAAAKVPSPLAGEGGAQRREGGDGTARREVA